VVVKRLNTSPEQALARLAEIGAKLSTMDDERASLVAERDALLPIAARIASRRKLAAISGVTAGRVQQIIGR
jgi:hypothetical protein